MTVHCALTDFDEAVLINRPVSPLLLLTVKTHARWWERTAVSRDERKLQEERKEVVPHTHNNRNALNVHTSHYLCQRKKREKEGEGGREKGRKAGTGVYSYNFVSFVSSSTIANASSSKNCIHTTRRLSA